MALENKSNIDSNKFSLLGLFLKSPIKMTLHFVMLLVFLGGISIWFRGEEEPSLLPQNINELQKFSVKVKLYDVERGLQTLTPEKYPVSFIVAVPAEKDVFLTAVEPTFTLENSHFKYMVKYGDDAGIYLTKNEIDMLNKMSDKDPKQDMVAYGIVMDNGRILADPSAGITGEGFRHLKWLGFCYVAISIIYCLIFNLLSNLFRRLRKKIMGK